MTGDSPEDHAARRVSDTRSLVGRMLLSVGDHNFIPSGTTVLCVRAGERVEMTYANPAVGVAGGTVEIGGDGSATIKHEFQGRSRVAIARVEILEAADYSRVIGEWRSKEGEAWGEFTLYELKSIEAP